MKSKPESIYDLVWHTRRLFQQLRETSDELLQGTGINPSQRAVLEFLVRDGSQSVATMAREKQVSRQHVQKVVNTLLQLSLVEPLDNPEHKRSPLIRVTAKGKRLFARISERESALLRAMAKNFDEGDIQDSVRTMKRIGAWLKTESVSGVSGGKKDA